MIKRRETFQQVLCNFDDQAVVRLLLQDICPEWVKAEVVKRFNDFAERCNDREIEWSDESMEDCETEGNENEK